MIEFMKYIVQILDYLKTYIDLAFYSRIAKNESFMRRQ